MPVSIEEAQTNERPTSVERIEEDDEVLENIHGQVKKKIVVLHDSFSSKEKDSEKVYFVLNKIDR